MIIFTVSVCHGSEDGSKQSNLTGIARILTTAGETIDVYKNIFTDLGVVGRWLDATFYHANISDLIPTRSFFPLMLSPSLDKYSLGTCPRADVYKCLYHGNYTLQILAVTFSDSVSSTFVAR